ncbi:MAG: ribbon-helix-helix domain-containing protein [Actinobacteria bacterium]|nr:ribbon-helix-helix domain-containing protein [Actinomycetota bacterium]
MRRTNIYLTDEQCVQLDRRADAAGVSRAEVIRRLIDAGLAADDDDLARDLDVLHGSFAALADDDIAFERGDDDRMRHLDAIAGR